MSRSIHLPGMGAGALVRVGPVGFAQSGGRHGLTWSTIDGGGIQASAGGGWELSGTIGQPDAGVSLSGGEYELTGGFWPRTPSGPAICAGDTNCDGSVSYADINPFIKALGNLSAWQAQYPSCPWQNCDIDANGMVNYADINPFVQKLGSPGPCP